LIIGEMQKLMIAVKLDNSDGFIIPRGRLESEKGLNEVLSCSGSHKIYLAG